MIAGPTSYAAVGMGAVFAGAAHAPFTAIAIIAEMTGNWVIVGPLAVGCLLSTLITRRVREANMYTTGLLDEDVDVGSRRRI